MIHDRELQILWAGVVAVLAAASLAGWALARRAAPGSNRATVDNLNARLRAWWVMTAVVSFAFAAGATAVIVLFGLISFLALREFLTLTPTRYGDHRALFWSFFVVTPLQYYLLAIPWYGLFSTLIPVYVFLLLPTRVAAAGDTTNFLERTAKAQWGLMVCVFCVSHAPAVLTLLDLRGYAGQNGKLLFWFVLVCELSDVMQWLFGKTLGRHPMAPTVSPNKTWEGTIGGVLSTAGVGAALWWATPFSPAEAAGMGLVVAACGVAGGLVMSAVKRDLGVKDWGTTLEGHGGILDRIDSLCFAAPVFFHLTRYYFRSIARRGTLMTMSVSRLLSRPL